MKYKEYNKSPIFVVEDSEEDYIAATRAFKKVSIFNPVIRFQDGDDAYQFLDRNYGGEEIIHKWRAWIVLDLNLPYMGGKTFLKLLKRDSRFRKIPDMILSTSADENDVQDYYQMGANGYLKKLQNFKSFVRAVEALKRFGVKSTILPSYRNLSYEDTEEYISNR